MKKWKQVSEDSNELKRSVRIHNQRETKEYVNRIMSNTTWIDCPNYKEMRL